MNQEAAPVVDPDQDLPASRTHLPNREQQRQLRRRRGVKDRFSRVFVGVGGISVIISLGLIFLYLFLEVLPLLRPARLEETATYNAPGGVAADTLHLALERFREVAVRYTSDGRAVFFEPDSGDVRLEQRLPIPDGVTVTAVGTGEPRTRTTVLGLSDGTALIVQDAYDVSYPGDVRRVTPKLELPLGAEPQVVDPEGRPLTAVAAQRNPQGGFLLAAATTDGRLRLVAFEATVNFLTGEIQLTRQEGEVDAPPVDWRRVLISMDLRDLIVADAGGGLTYYDVRNVASPRLVDTRQVLAPGDEVTALNYLLGTVSLIVGGSDGSVSQWLLARDQANVRRFTFVRDFSSHRAPVVAISPEYARKGFVTADEAGTVGLHFATSSRTLLQRQVAQHSIRYARMAPRADALLVADELGIVHYLRLHNEHPQFSFAALWNRVWYEGRNQPEYIWQSSSATDEFEPKFSLVPLTVGTIKAALYAMLFSIPLALMGAVYTGYFMTPKMRGIVKPTIEIMEALPTVILGFLAGLWFAPFVENHLPAVFSILILMPAGMLLLAFLWNLLPRHFRARIPDGWEAALLLPVVLGVTWLCVGLSPMMELWFFDGSMRQWFTENGIVYDQRNAMVVGVAMGFAVIPTIFSIAEDAIFSVPRHLSQGSLALGATPWQTMVRVVLLTASPGLFSAVMIGLGRAVGETMIVLMATGNSPVVNFNIFEGMRTLSANIAVEMPETEVGGTHYRILFLAALVLFLLTFVFNTVAEIVRQRLRRKYQSL